MFSTYSGDRGTEVIITTKHPWKNGVSCGHRGCLNHVTHPCEYCGRIAGKNKSRLSSKNVNKR